MGQGELFFQLTNPFSLGVDRGFERSPRAAVFPTASQEGEQGQNDAGSYRTEDDQYQRGLIFPQQEFDRHGIGILKRKDCSTQREKKGKYQGGHVSHSHDAVLRKNRGLT